MSAAQSTAKEIARRMRAEALRERLVVRVDSVWSDSPDGITQDSWGPETDRVRGRDDAVEVKLYRLVDGEPTPLDRVALTKVIEQLERMLAGMSNDVRMSGPDVPLSGPAAPVERSGR